MKKLVTLLLSVLCVLSLVACGDNKTKLEKYFDDPAAKKEIQQAIDDTLASTGDTYTEIGFEVEGDTISYIYTVNNSYKGQLDKGSMESYLDGYAPSLVKDIEKSGDVGKIKVRCVFKFADGTGIIDKTYE